MIKMTQNRYIISDSDILNGEPIIKGTRTPVRAIVETWRMGVNPEEIPIGMPHLTLAQVFDALSYYSDNMAEINHYIELNRIPDDLIENSCQAMGLGSFDYTKERQDLLKNLTRQELLQDVEDMRKELNNG